MAWAKKRALKYLDRNDPLNAVTSMLSDLNKHPETRAVNTSVAEYGILIATRSVAEARRFIEGFL